MPCEAAMHQLPYSGKEYAEQFGLVCRRVFRGENWEECRSSVRKSWDALAGIHESWKAQAMTWEEAQPFIHKAWSPS
ncbi:hypothetical protein GCM10027431_26890 [Lysobacter rhizosphaerae]